MNEPTNKLFQDEPGYGAQGLGKWFASRLGARQALRNIFPYEPNNVRWSTKQEQANSDKNKGEMI